MRVAVIGAGVAGLACAQRLAGAGLSPRVIDKGRGLGGRLATRRRPAGQFDHGAQAIHAQTQQGRAWLAGAVDAGHAAPWPAAAEHAPERAGPPVVGTPGMSSLCRPLAEKLDITRATRVLTLARTAAGWEVHTADGRQTFDRVVLTTPAPQAAALLSSAAPDLSAEVAGVPFAPCHTLMIAFARRPDWPELVRAPGGAVDLVLRDASKPGRDAGAECWVAHTTAAWSAAHLELELEAAAAALQDALSEVFGPLPPVVLAMAHRWRYARATRPLGRPCAATDDGTLLVGGDWATGQEAEDAFLSGRAMADALLGGTRP